MLPVITLVVLVSAGPQPGPLAAASKHARVPLHALQAGGDSLGNGALAGAITGGIAGGVFIAWLCGNVSEEGSDPCWKAALVGGALGAGAGTLLGMGIDALAQRRQPVAFELPGGSPRLRTRLLIGESRVGVALTLRR